MTVGVGGAESVGENVADVGVGDLLGPRWERVMERPMELKNDMVWY